MGRKENKIAFDTEFLNKLWNQSLEENFISDSNLKDLSNLESKEADQRVSSATIEKIDHINTKSTADNTLPVSEASFDKNSVFITKVYSTDEKVSRILMYGKAVFYIGAGISAVLHGIAQIIEALR